MPKEVIIIGAGGHGKVIADIVIKSGDKLLGFLDDNLEKKTNIVENHQVLGKIEECVNLQKENKELCFIIAIGNNYTRKMIYEKYNLNYYTAIHPNSNIGMAVQIGEGTAIMANACINSNTKIGKNCIINTGAVVEHDNKIEDYVHVSPNATLCRYSKSGGIYTYRSRSYCKKQCSSERKMYYRCRSSSNKRY